HQVTQRLYVCGILRDRDVQLFLEAARQKELAQHVRVLRRHTGALPVALFDQRFRLRQSDCRGWEQTTEQQPRNHWRAAAGSPRIADGIAVDDSDRIDSSK